MSLKLGFSAFIFTIILIIKYFGDEVNKKTVLQLILFSLVVPTYKCIICWKMKRLGLEVSSWLTFAVQA